MVERIRFLLILSIDTCFTLPAMLAPVSCRVWVCTQTGHTPLHWAACYGFVDVASVVLRAASVKIDIVDEEGKTPLMWCVPTSLADSTYAHACAHTRPANACHPASERLLWRVGRGSLSSNALWISFTRHSDEECRPMTSRPAH